MLHFLDVFEEHPLIQSLLIHDYFSNLPEDKNNTVRAIVQRFIKKSKKQLYVCEHDGCNEPAINSHEISEKKFLKKLANNHQKLFVIKNDLKNNAFLNYFKEEHIGNITFPGYCQKHDVNLFKELDQFLGKFNSLFVNKQALRSTKKEIREHQIIIKIAEEIIQELKIIPSIESSDVYINLIKKIKIQKERLLRLEIIYQEILLGIEKNQLKVVYKIFDLKPSGY